MKSHRVIFVYNASSDVSISMVDFVHKIVSPSTYECNLCALTHHNFGPKKEWKSFLENTTAQLEFYHKNEYQKQFASKFGNAYQPPFILKVNGYDEEIMCSAKKINSFTKLSELILFLEEQLKD